MTLLLPSAIGATDTALFSVHFTVQKTLCAHASLAACAGTRLNFQVLGITDAQRQGHMLARHKGHHAALATHRRQTCRRDL